MAKSMLKFFFKFKLLILESTLPLSLILLLGLAMLLIEYNLESAVRSPEKRYALEIFIRSDIPQAKIDSLNHYLRHLPACERTEIISQQTALDRMTEILGEDPTEVLDYNPLPMSIVFFPTDSHKNRSYLQVLKQQVEQDTIVERAIFAGDWLLELENFNSLFVKVTLIFLILAFLSYLMLFRMALNQLWLRYHNYAHKLYLLGMSRFHLRIPTIIWSVVVAVLAGVSSLAILGISTSIITHRMINLQFFPPRLVAGIIAIFIIIHILMAILKRVKIQAYE